VTVDKVHSVFPARKPVEFESERPWRSGRQGYHSSIARDGFRRDDRTHRVDTSLHAGDARTADTRAHNASHPV
jgi:hypothetical protein